MVFMTMTYPSLSIIIPVFNEEQLLLPALDYLKSELAKMKLTYEIILVENGSTDRSPVMIKKLAQENKFIKAFFLPQPNYGKALYTGFTSSGKELVANFSVDWMDISFLKSALFLIPDFDCVLASKNKAKSRDRRPFSRRFGSRCFHFMVRLLFQIPLTDTHGIGLYKRAPLTKIIKSCPPDSETFSTELLIRLYQAGYSLKEIPVIVSEKRPTRVKILKRGLIAGEQIIKLRLRLLLKKVQSKSSF